MQDISTIDNEEEITELAPIFDKAMETALRVLEEARSSVPDKDFYIYCLALEMCIQPHTAPDWDHAPIIKHAALWVFKAVLQDNFRKHLDKARRFLGRAEGREAFYYAVPEYRDEDIEHLRNMLAYWRLKSSAVLGIN